MYRHEDKTRHKRTTFWGGVRPPARKALTQAASPRPVSAPRTLIYPVALLEEEAPPPLPVEAGDQVLAGQRLFVGANGVPSVFASVSGRVSAIEKRWHPNGRLVYCVVVENDFQYTRHPSMQKRPDAGALHAQELLQLLRGAGIHGPGGMIFAPEQPVKWLLINGCECEPYVTADDSLMCRYPEQVVAGAGLIARLLKPERAIIAIEENKPQSIAALKGQLLGTEIALHVLPTRYPQGAKEQLIQAVTDKQVPPGGTPADVGAAVYNVSTCASVYKAVYEGEPILKRIVTVTGGAVKNPANFIAYIGTPLSHLIEAAGGFRGAPHKIIAGGPMMGVAQSVLDAPIIRTVNAVLCLGEEDRVTQEHPTCLRCGKCLSVCPMHLQPLYIHRYEAANNMKGLKRLNVEDCTECGCCAYTCPGKVPLVEDIRRAKSRLKQAEGGESSI